MTAVAFPHVPDVALDDRETLVTRPELPFEPNLPNVFVVPAFNEEANLPRLFSELEEHGNLFSPGSRLIIVDDGSQDATAAIAEAYDGPLPVELVRMGTNQGPGAAFRAGFAAALGSETGEALVVTLEADTTSDLGALPAMLRRADEGAGLVLASVHGGGAMENVSAFRRVLSRGAGFTIRRALGVQAKTVSSFFRVYRASLLRHAAEHYGENLIREHGFACKAELLAKLGRLGARIEEVPVNLDGSKRLGESKMRILPTLVGYWRLMARQRLSRDSAPA
jgi:dolichol-phosphate mannosyltransferase